MGQIRYKCPRCGLIHFKQEGSFSFDCRSCGTPLKQWVSKRQEKQNKLAKAQLKHQEKLIRAHDYPYYFGRKTFME